MITQGVVPFIFQEQRSVRIIIIDNDPWFCLRDACVILDIRNPSPERFQLDGKGVTRNVIPTEGGEQEVIFINEPNLYRVIFRSNKPEAKAFQDWVFNEVLPAIRKTGRYVAPQTAPAPAYISGAEESQMSNLIWRLARHFYMEGSVKHWLYKYANALAGVHRRQFIPASQFPEVLAMLNSLETQADAYLNERIRHEKEWLLLTLKRELDQRLGRVGPEFEMLAASADEPTV